MKKIMLDPGVTVSRLLNLDIANKMDYRVQLLVPNNDYTQTHYILTCRFNGAYVYTNIPIDLDMMMIDDTFTHIKFILYTPQQLAVYEQLMSYLRYMGIIAMSMDIPIGFGQNTNKLLDK